MHYTVCKANVEFSSYLYCCQIINEEISLKYLLIKITIGKSSYFVCTVSLLIWRKNNIKKRWEALLDRTNEDLLRESQRILTHLVGILLTYDLCIMICFTVLELKNWFIDHYYQKILEIGAHIDIPDDIGLNIHNTYEIEST